MGEIQGLHHAQITIPPEAEDGARQFYCGVLGLTEIAKPEALSGRGGFWLRVGTQEVHVGTEPCVDRTATGPAAAGNPHLAYAVDDLLWWRERLAHEGIVALDAVPLPGYKRFEFRDPFGNRVELIAVDGGP